MKKKSLLVMLLVISFISCSVLAAPVQPGDDDLLFLFNADEINVSNDRYGVYYGLETTTPDWLGYTTSQVGQVDSVSPAYEKAANLKDHAMVGATGDTFGAFNGGSLQTFSFGIYLKVDAANVGTKQKTIVCGSYSEFKFSTLNTGAVVINTFQSPLDNTSTSVTTLASSGVDIWDGEWHEIIATYDHTDDSEYNAFMYVDGVKVGEAKVAYGEKLYTDTDGKIQYAAWASDTSFPGAVDNIWLKNGVVPEPATLGLLVIGGVAGLIRRRK